MFYLARCAVILNCDINDFQKNTWYKYPNDTKYKMRLKDDLCLEVICSCFENKFEALNCAKNMYAALIYHLLKNDYMIENNECCCYNYFNIHELGSYSEADEEKLFIYSPDSHYHYTGFGVFEVPNSTEDFDKLYSFEVISCTFSSSGNLLKKFNPQKTVFSYNSEVETLLYDLIEADCASNLGLKMTIYCGLLEHIAGLCIEQKAKDDDIISFIDELITQTKKSGLDKNKTNQLISYLNKGKDKSALSKCREVIGKYAKQEYGGYKTKDIINKAYKIRSTYSHGENTPLYNSMVEQMKFILLDVIKGYVLEKENDKCPNNQQQ